MSLQGMTRGDGVFVRFKNTKKEKESGRVGYAIWCLFFELSLFVRDPYKGV